MLLPMKLPASMSNKEYVTNDIIEGEPDTSGKL